MNKTILITGATSGFGRAIAVKFAHNGYTVGITGRRENRLQELKKELEESYNATVIPLVFDVRDKEQVASAIDDLKKQVATVDILVNNAGIYPFEPFLQMPEANFEKVIDINLKGYFLMAQACAKEMVKQKSGSIVNISSIAMGQVG